MCKVRRRHRYDKTFTVYSVRVDEDGDTLFFIYEDNLWSWVFADDFVPVED